MDRTGQCLSGSCGNAMRIKDHVKQCGQRQPRISNGELQLCGRKLTLFVDAWFHVTNDLIIGFNICFIFKDTTGRAPRTTTEYLSEILTKFVILWKMVSRWRQDCCRCNG